MPGLDLRETLQRAKAAAIAQVHEARLSLLPAAAKAPPHGLPGRLVVSLTSFHARFHTLHLTLRSLLQQSIKPDEVVLWVGHGDFDRLPKKVLDLQSHGLTIRTCEDIRSYTKIIPSLRAYPDAFIVTADDDVYYWNDWLKELVESYDPATRLIPCHRCHLIRTDAEGLPLPYLQWELQLDRPLSSALVFVTGVGGVLYPPGSLHPQVLDEAQFRSLCPTTDDVWLYWMARRAGWEFRQIGRRRRVLNWNGSQKMSLMATNVPEGGGNDQQLGNLIRAYTWPPVSA